MNKKGELVGFIFSANYNLHDIITKITIQVSSAILSYSIFNILKKWSRYLSLVKINQKKKIIQL